MTPVAYDRVVKSPGTSTSAPNPRRLRFALIAGEASGDQLGASLIRALHVHWPDAQFAGVGGSAMREAGQSQWSDYTPLAVMGIAEVLRHLPRLLRFRRDLVKRLLDWQPDVFVGIDAPDFNLGVEKRLKENDVTTVHYVSPSIWAWREKRAAKIGTSADRVLCLFPMEPPIYAHYGVDARFVGHPLADAFPDEPDRDAARTMLGIERDATVLAVLPGSRLGEVRRLAPVFLGVAHRLARKRTGLCVLVPAANATCRRALVESLDRLANDTDGKPIDAIRLLDGQSHQAMIAADAVLLASGTAALECALAKRPMVVGYRIAPLTHFIVKSLGLLKIDRFSLPNVLSGCHVVPEFMQQNCTVDAIAPAVAELLDSETARQRQIDGFRQIHAELLVSGGASAAAAAAIADLLARTRLPA
jgi:lipid-A-disaccharide synthase